jgi:hypothetical protein
MHPLVDRVREWSRGRFFTRYIPALGRQAQRDERRMKQHLPASLIGRYLFVGGMIDAPFIDCTLGANGKGES